MNGMIPPQEAPYTMPAPEMKTFYIPGQEGIKVGDTITLKVVSADEKNGDLEVQFAGQETEEYTPEEPPEEAFT